MLRAIRDAVIANGGTSAPYSLIGAWRALVSAYGGTPTQYSVTGLMREAVAAAGGTPTQWTERGLLRELLGALGESVTSYRMRDLYLQLAGALAAPPTEVPANVSLPVISGTTTVGETLTATNGTWSNAPSSYARQWYADAVAIAGATGSSYELTEAEEGAEITVGVIATNVVGDSAEAVSAAVGPVAAAPVPDTTPDAFAFTDATDAELSTVTTSNQLTLAGTDTNAAISITGGEYQVGAGSWTSASGTIAPGSLFRVRLTSSASYSTIASATLTIGGVSDTFSVTTKADPTPTPTPTPTDYNAALTPPEVSLAVPADSFPPSFTLDWFGDDLLENDQVEAERSDTSDFSGTIYTHGPVTADAAAAAAEELDFGFSSVLSGVYYYRFRRLRGTGYGDWSAVVGHGDSVAPTITGGTTSSAERAPMAVTVTADEPAYFTLGGADAALLEKSGSEPATSITVRLIGNADLNLEGKASYSFTVTGTDLAGNVGTPAAFTHNVNDVDEQPDSFSFTDTAAGTVSTVYTSTVTIAGLATGVTVSGTFSGDGDYRKNGGAWVTTSPFTATNGDTIESRITSSASGATAKANTFSIGEPAVSDTHTVTTASTFAPSTLWTAAQFGYALDPTDTSKVWQDSARTTPGAAAQPVGALDDIGSGSGRNFTQTTSGKRPTLVDIGGGVLALQFDGTDDHLMLAAAGLYNAGGCTVIFAAKNLNTAQVDRRFMAEDNTASVNARYTPATGISSAATRALSYVRNDASTIVDNGGGWSGNEYDGNWNVHTIKDSGSLFSLSTNRGSASTRSYTRSGTLTLNRSFLGAFFSGGTFGANATNMQIGRFIAIARTDLTSGELADAETWCATPYGIVLP